MVIYLILILFERYVRYQGGALAISQILNNALVQQTRDDDLTQGNLGTRAKSPIAIINCEILWTTTIEIDPVYGE